VIGSPEAPLLASTNLAARSGSGVASALRARSLLVESPDALALDGRGTLSTHLAAMGPNGTRAGSLEQTEAGEAMAVDPAAADRDAVRALVDRAKEGDAAAFGAIFDRFQPEIVRYLAHRTGNIDTAEDLAQQVFLKAWQAIPRFEHRGAPFKSWLYRMAHNQMVDHFRTNRPTTDLEGIDVPEEATAERELLAGETNERLLAALDRLSDDHRQVLTLRFLMEQSAREIGQIMDRKEVTVRGLQMRALQALRREIDAIGGIA
jgi:RNA polymerase sigma-70 factor (ECF subfamily)